MMKKKRNLKPILMGITSLFFVCSSVIGQQKNITKDEYNSAIGAASAESNKLAFRSIEITKYFTKEKLDETQTYISESLPPNRQRWLSVTEKEGVVTERSERIKIGNIEYTKNGDEQWKKLKLKKNGSGSLGAFKIDPMEIENLNEYILIETTLNNRPVNVYFHYQVIKVDGYLRFFESRDWIDSEGRLVKTTNKDSITYPENIISQETTTFIFDPKDLTIKPPIK